MREPKLPRGTVVEQLCDLLREGVDLPRGVMGESLPLSEPLKLPEVVVGVFTIQCICVICDINKATTI